MAFVGFTPQQRLVLVLAGVGLVMLAAVAGHVALGELGYDGEEVAYVILIGLGAGCLIGAWVVAKVLGLRK